MGTEDLHKSLGIGRDADRTGLLYALSRCVFAASAAGTAARTEDSAKMAANADAGLAKRALEGVSLMFMDFQK